MPYGNSGTGVAVGGGLAATGFAALGWTLAAITMIFVGIALIALFRKGSTVKP